MNDPIQALLAAGVPVGGELPPTSRYRDIQTAVLTGDGDHPIVFFRRRLCPQPDATAQSRGHLLAHGDRLDQVAARRLGDPALWWRIADANGAIDPQALVEEPELDPLPPRRVLRIPTGVHGD